MARGATVVIDVFRAFSTACHAFLGGCERIFPVLDVDDARALAASVPGALLMGERFTRKLPGFDLGNSPTEIVAADVRGRTIVHTTHAGTRGLVVAAERAPVLFAGSFVNAAATAASLRQAATEDVSLVCMGHQAEEPSDEDTLCAGYLRDLVLGRPPSPSFDEIREQLRSSAAAAKFFDPARPWTPPSDFDLCLALDAAPFALRCDRDPQGRLVLRTDAPPGPAGA